MTWEKGTIQDALNTWSFSDQYGLSYFSVKSIELKIGENWHDLSKIYKEYGSSDGINYKRLDLEKNKNLFKFFKKFFDDEWIVALDSKEHCHDILTQNRVIKITLRGIMKIKFQIEPYSANSKNSKGSISYIQTHFTVNNSRDFDKVDCLNEDKKVHFLIPNHKTSSSDSPIEYFDRPNIENVQVGDKYFYPPKNSICEIVKKYDSSDPSNKLYDVKLTDKNMSIITIKKHEDLLSLPYAQTKYDMFNKSMNESMLQPYVEREDSYFYFKYQNSSFNFNHYDNGYKYAADGDFHGKGTISGAGKTYNVYWQEIENATLYIVSVYKIIEFSHKTNIYHLKDIKVNKNEKMAIMDGLVGGNFVFIVKAEDCNGNVIAFSRGILNEGEPRLWNEDDDKDTWWNEDDDQDTTISSRFRSFRFW
ncbi:MAG TPA: hypothetical protein P5543_05535 [Planctomycetota bacterium]|nr:hypothetical protein [Planctomycetota bacterium]HRU51636.1 hypothetical protein [Planctomycetota bacterium]